MLSTCANPGCKAIFRYLHQGKVFLADWLKSTQNDDEFAGTCWRRTEMFWLCESCSRLFTLSKDGNSVVPIQAGLIKEDALPLKELRIGG